mmetsp:Transcript_111902/g.355787  ORF Transcript_111902/g.355787 Transcript_111902/m.355787 type:complete len:467 (-) Transcript_111902:71-1471(-)
MRSPLDQDLGLHVLDTTFAALPVGRQTEDLAAGEQASGLPRAAAARQRRLRASGLCGGRSAVPAEIPEVGGAILSGHEETFSCGRDRGRLGISRHEHGAGLVPRRRLVIGALAQLVQRHEAAGADDGAQAAVVELGSRSGGALVEQESRQGRHRQRSASDLVQAGPNGGATRDLARSRDDHQACVAPRGAACHAQLDEALEGELACHLAFGDRRDQRTEAACGEGSDRGLGPAGQHVWLECTRPLNRHRHHGPRPRRRRGSHLGEAAVAAVGIEVVRARVFGAPLRFVLAVSDGALGPGVLADAGNALEGLGALGLKPPGIGLRGEAEHIRGPKLLLTLGAPTLLPSPVTALRRDVRVVLGADGTVLPAIPLTGTRPRRCARIRHQHALAHDALHGMAGELDEPSESDDGDKGACVHPRGHVDLRQRVLADGIVVAVFLLLLQLLRGLRRRDEVHDVLESGRQPRR